MSRKIDSVDALQRQLWDMLVCVARVLEDARVDYHLAYGTALGAVRHCRLHSVGLRCRHHRSN